MRHEFSKIRLTSGLALLASFAFASVAQATTFPGTNGRIGASAPLAPFGTSPSRLEIFTMKSAYSYEDPTDPNDNPPDECRLTDNTNTDINPRFSKDGKMIAWLQDNNVWTMKLDAQGKCQAKDASNVLIPPTQVTNANNTDSFVGGFSPPDASGKSWIVFQRNITVGGFEVFKVQVDSNGAPITGTEVNLTNLPTNDSQPSFCSTGNKIAFHSNRSGNSDIWVMNADGSGAENRTFLSLAEESAPAYSGDCSKIAFQTDRAVFPRPNQPRNLEIYKMDADGLNVMRLSYNDYSGVGTGTDVTGFDLNPQWSPDGARICFHSGRNPDYRGSNGSSIIGQWDLYTLDAVNGEPHADNPNNASASATEQLTNRERNDERCGWQEKPGT